MSGSKEGKTEHPTQKPIECMARPIRNHDSEFVYDPFLGSGTTLIACEQLGRKCRAIEIHPPYVAVALQRWADATGKTPVLI
jgi:DNA modification methylase